LPHAVGKKKKAKDLSLKLNADFKMIGTVYLDLGIESWATGGIGGSSEIHRLLPLRAVAYVTAPCCLRWRHPAWLRTQAHG
jgi:hypothetical protein